MVPEKRYKILSTQCSYLEVHFKGAVVYFTEIVARLFVYFISFSSKDGSSESERFSLIFPDIEFTFVDKLFNLTSR